jgi:hypothetical protein
MEHLVPVCHATSEEDAGDLGGRETLRSEQHYAQPQPPARLAFSLHFPYEIPAFGGGDGDTLHGRPFHWWLDGFGIFTMPQETVVCSITLCIYLGRARTCASKLVAGAGVSGSNPLVGSLILLQFAGETPEVVDIRSRTSELIYCNPDDP